MYCPKCGKQLPEDSVFCINCGTKIDAITNTNISKKHLIKKIATNMTSNIIALIICFVLAIIGFNAGKENYSRIENRAELVSVTQNLIDLTDSSPYVLGSSETYKEELRGYKSDYMKTVVFAYGGYIVSAIGAISVVYLGYNLYLILKKKGENNVL